MGGYGSLGADKSKFPRHSDCDADCDCRCVFGELFSPTRLGNDSEYLADYWELFRLQGTVVVVCFVSSLKITI